MALFSLGFDMALTPLRALAASLLALLAFGAFTLYVQLTLPGQLGFFRDDGMYALFARALATGQGYVDLSWVGHPPAPRYPIGFPGLLALVIYGAGDLQAQIGRLQLVPPVVGVAFVAVSFWYLRRQAGWALGVALGGAALLAFHPAVVTASTVLMADLAFGVLALLGLVAAERAIRTPSPRAWAIAGLWVGLACLTRYFGVTLVIAVVAVLLHRRAFSAIGAFGLGLAAVMAPWLAFRALRGGETYTDEVGLQLFEQADAVGKAILTALRAVLRVSLPDLGLAGLAAAPDPLAWLAGCALAIVLAAGTWLWIRGARGDHAPIAPLYLIGTVALAAVMEFGYTSYGGSLFTRYTTPVLPLALVALGWLGSRVWPVERLRRAVATGVLGMCLLAAGWTDFQNLNRHQAAMRATAGLEDYSKLYAFLRERTAPDARLMGWYGHALTFYTGRYGRTIPTDMSRGGFDASPEQLYQALLETGSTHVVGTPRIEPGGDASVRLLNSFSQAHPGLLKPVYVSHSGNFVVFEVTRP